MLNGPSVERLGSRIRLVGPRRNAASALMQVPAPGPWSAQVEVGLIRAYAGGPSRSAALIRQQLPRLPSSGRIRVSIPANPQFVVNTTSHERVHAEHVNRASAEWIGAWNMSVREHDGTWFESEQAMDEAVACSASLGDLHGPIRRRVAAAMLAVIGIEAEYLHGIDDPHQALIDEPEWIGAERTLQFRLLEATAGDVRHRAEPQGSSMAPVPRAPRPDARERAVVHTVLLASAAASRSLARLPSSRAERGHRGPDAAPIGRRLARDVVTRGGVTYYEFRIGVEVSAALARAASAQTRTGPLRLPALPALVAIAERDTGVVDDPARLFLAGLLEPSNAALLQAAASATSVSFPVSGITVANRARVDDAGRPALPGARSTVGPASPSERRADEAAVRAVRAAVGARRAQADALLSFAHDQGIPARQLLAAMRSAAAGSTGEDRLMAACAYAIARAVGSPVVPSLLSGALHVDAVRPPTVSRPGALQIGVAAEYVRQPLPPTVPTSAGRGGPGLALRGDTLYVPNDFRIDNAMQRSILLHELDHARQDLTGILAAHPLPTPDVYSPTWARAEYETYREQALYLLQDVATMTTPQRATARRDIVALLHDHPNPAFTHAMLLVAGANRPRDELFVTELLTDPGMPTTDHMTASEVAAALAQPEAARERDLHTALSVLFRHVTRTTQGGSMIHDSLGRPSIADYNWIRPPPPTVIAP